jgi:RNA polymerase sigma-70 factor (ECF subfamily)
MDDEQLRALLECHHAESYGWARCCCRQDPNEGENVLHAAYLKILERKAVFDGRSAFRTWLFSVIRNTASEHRRRRFFQKLKLIEYRAKEVSPPELATQEDSLYRDEMERTLRSALAALPARQSEVLHLVFYQELSLAEAAQVMRVSVGSARTHYDRGKRKLRAWIEEKNIT